LFKNAVDVPAIIPPATPPLENITDMQTGLAASANEAGVRDSSE